MHPAWDDLPENVVQAVWHIGALAVTDATVLGNTGLQYLSATTTTQA